MMDNNVRFKYLLISDIHLGHDTNKCEMITNNLRAYFKMYAKYIATVDMIIISGDVFHKLLSVNSTDSILAFRWLSLLAIYCRNSKIKLRILEGTPSHDWKQVKLLNWILDTIDLKDLDYKYYDKLDIEILEEYDDLSILYLPDEWKDNAEIIYEDVLKTLKAYSLDKVDMTVMHGAFTYQIPYHKSDQLHSEKAYMDITNYTINCGHVHTRSQYDSILVPGSFDRLTHSDDKMEKGGLLVTLYKDSGKFSYKFLKNVKAVWFETIDITDIDVNTLHKQLKGISKKHPISYIRLLNKREGNSTSSILNELTREYPSIKFTITNKISDTDKPVITNQVVKSTNIKFDKDTLREMVVAEIRLMKLPDEDAKVILEELDMLLED